ncbi:MAG: hypothetical protein J07HQX50_00721 [Haloquadratum sp. J07HQX50]|jgi:hypothetical protein|nr:MAG: hypothetical protein J07HQX50_00721 [Haloquadratum sp. J07HQX50]
MLSFAIESYYAWIGLALTGTVLISVVIGLPTQAPLDASGVTATIDTVGVATFSAAATHPVEADDIRIGRHRISLKRDGDIAHATVSYGPMTPVRAGHSGLAALIDGTPPSDIFETPQQFEAALTQASVVASTPSWQQVRGPVHIRRVTYGPHSALLVDV